MLSHKLFGSGLSGLTVESMRDVTTGISAAGTNQATATALTAAINYIGTVAANTGVSLFATAVSGDSQKVYNGGANPLNVYPQSGASINQLSTNAAMILPINTQAEFTAVSTTQWIGMLSR